MLGGVVEQVLTEKWFGREVAVREVQESGAKGFSSPHPCASLAL